MEMGPPWDNGNVEDWGKKGTFIQYGPAWAQVGAGPFRMFKGFLSEGGIRTPLIISGMNVAGSGRISDAVVHVKDVPATILEAAGVTPPTEFGGRKVAAIEGKGIGPVLSNTADAIRTPEDWTGWELFGNRAIRQGDWKLLWLCKPFGPAEWQLFNLKDDPGETKDIAPQHPEIRDQMVKHWESYVKTNGVILPESSPVCGKNDAD
jgi:arylsulfatase